MTRTRKNPWDATSYRNGDKIEVRDRYEPTKWHSATVQKAGGWRLIVAYPGGGAEAIDSPTSVRKRVK
jgi:hypothetical protein